MVTISFSVSTKVIHFIPIIHSSRAMLGIDQGKSTVLLKFQVQPCIHKVRIVWPVRAEVLLMISQCQGSVSVSQRP